MTGTTRSTGQQGGRRYRVRFLDGFVTGYSFQPYGFTEGVWGPKGDAVTLSFPTTAIRDAHPTPGNGPITAQYPDLGAGRGGAVGAKFTLAYRTPTGEYCPVMMPTDRIA